MIPIVSISNPIGSGFVASLARPGGNLTGLLQYEASITGKWLTRHRSWPRSVAGFAGTQWRWSFKFLQERSETFRDRLFDAVLGLEALPDCQQPRPPGQDVIAFLARGQRPFRYEGRPIYANNGLAPTGSSSSRCALACPRPPSTTCPLLLTTPIKI